MIEIKIPSEIVNQIQQYDIQCRSRQEIITRILNQNITCYNQQLFNNYQKEYEEKYYLFEKAKQELEDKYVKPNVSDTDKYTWELIYFTNTLIINKKEEE